MFTHITYYCLLTINLLMNVNVTKLSITNLNYLSSYNLRYVYINTRANTYENVSQVVFR